MCSTNFDSMMHFIWIFLFLVYSDCTSIEENDPNGNPQIFDGAGYREGTGRAESRIVGGETSSRIYPFMVSVQRIFTSGEIKHDCAGAIVSKNCILTGAHCTYAAEPRDLSILAGTNQLLRGGGRRYSIKSIIEHEDFDSCRLTKDIAVIKIKGNFEFNDHIAPIKYSSKKISANETATFVGCGYLNPSRRGEPNELQRVFLPTISNEECKEAGVDVTNSQICTFSHVFQGACKADFGGPLTIGDGQEVIGIFSFGTRDCATGFPDVYTRVSEYHSWIAEKCAN